MTSRKVTIVGAGLSGSLMAIFLARRGCEVDVYEARGDLRRESLVGGRSINLTISARGMDALRRVGLQKRALDELSTELRSRVVHDRACGTTYIPYGVQPHEVLHSVSRAQLTSFLLNAAESEPGIHLHFHQRCVAIDKAAATVTFVDQLTGEQRKVTADLVVGADGVQSAVRREMQRGELVDFSQHYVPWRYKELTIDPGASEVVDRQALHVWPRGDFMMFALPDRGPRLNGVCVLPTDGPNSFDQLRTPGAVRAFFGGNFPDVVRFMPHLVEEFLDRPASGFPTIRTSSWHHQGTVVLIGDACHGVIPFYGQGMNAAFEDCVVLDECLGEDWKDWASALHAYQQRRRVHTDVLADLSIANFAELRDTVLRPSLAARKRVSRFAHRLLGDRAAPLYSLVSHSTIPYADCVRIAESRDRFARLLGADLAVAAVMAHGALTRVIKARIERLSVAGLAPNSPSVPQPEPVRRAA